MSYSEEQRQAIIEFSKSKYALGYKEGYVSGLICGVLLSTITLVVFKLTKI
jgi:tetrahydromethanopterin S-methyltransferase subunit F